MSTPVPSSGGSPSVGSPVSGILALLASGLLFTLMDSLIKYLGGNYPVIQTMLFRQIFGILPVLVALAIMKPGTGARRHALRVGSWRVHLIRGVLIVAAQGSFFTGITLMPFAEAISLAFVAPLFMALLAGPLLGEKVRGFQWLAIAIGFGGVLLVVGPTGHYDSLGALLVLGGALCYALLMVTARQFAGVASSLSLTLYSGVIPTLVAALGTPWVWTPPTLSHLGLYVALGIFGGSAVLLVNSAMRRAPVAIIAPFDYVTLVWATLIGWLVWREFPAPVVWLGVALIVCGGLLLLWNEHRRQRTLQARSLVQNPPGV